LELKKDRLLLFSLVGAVLVAGAGGFAGFGDYLSFYLIFVFFCRVVREWEGILVPGLMYN
jgi:hypothetical protein